MPRPATLEELLLRQLRDFAESSGLADVVPVEATLASAELLQMGVEQAEETKLKLQVAGMLGCSIQCCLVPCNWRGHCATSGCMLDLTLVRMAALSEVAILQSNVAIQQSHVASCSRWLALHLLSGNMRVQGSHAPLCVAPHVFGRRGLHVSSRGVLLPSTAASHAAMWSCGQGNALAWSDTWRQLLQAVRVAADSSSTLCAALRWVLADMQELERACR